MQRQRRGIDGRVESAGTEPTGVHPLTLEVLGERGIDWQHATSKHLERFVADPWDDVSRCATRRRSHARCSPEPSEWCTGASPIPLR